MKKSPGYIFLKLILAAILMGFISMRANAQYGAYDSLNANNISGRINNIGDNFDNFGSGARGFTAPKNSNKGTIFSSALWIGGYQNNNLKVAAMTYRQSGIDFFPGPLDTVSATISDSEMNVWNHVWKIKKSEINDFKANHTIYASIANWPGNGSSNTKQSLTQAPYVDVDHDGIYNPLKGDYPAMKGDEMLWWVFNDNANKHGETGGKPMGIEINAEAYEFNSSIDAINNTIFMDYKITNRSDTDITKAFIGLWTDFDIGYPFDDYIGSAPKLSAYFGYNGTPTDAVYGTNTPIESVIFLKDSMSRFLYYENNFSAINGNPGSGSSIPQPGSYYNYLAGLWKNNACMKYGYDGVIGTQCTNYMFDGDVSDTLSGWTEHNVGNVPGDRRGLGSIGPFTIKAHETFDFPFAYLFAQKTGGNTVTNFELMKQYWTEVKNYYNTNYTSAVNDGTPTKESFKIFPNPSNGTFSIVYANPLVQKFVIIDNTGREVYTEIPGKGKSESIIDVSELASGVYTVILETTNDIDAQKLIISR